MITHLLQPLICPRFRNDARYREGHLRVINALPARKVLGLHAPEMKGVARTLSVTDGAGYIKAFEQEPPQNLCYEETVIWGLLINRSKCSIEARLQMLEKYIPIMDNWAVCDSFCASAKWAARADKQLLWQWLQRWFASSREFEVRFAVVFSMCYMLEQPWIETLFARIDEIDFDKIKSEYRSIKGKPKAPQEGSVQGAEPYYVRMAVAWLLATALAKHPALTRGFVAASHLPADVVKLYVRKARESFRTRNVAAL